VIVLGIDPGSRAMGWGVVRCQGSEVRHVAHGVFRAKGADLHARLDAIYQEVGRLVREFGPSVAAVENVFVHKNVKAAMVLAGARTSAVLALIHGSVQVFSYTPSEVKKQVTGGGGADKAQVAQMVRFLLALDEVPPSDASDALGMALCHGMRGPGIRGADA